MSELVTIKVSDYSPGLIIAKSYLEDHGIASIIKEELINQLYPFFSDTAGGAKLQVIEEDAKRARYLLIEGGFIKKEE